MTLMHLIDFAEAINVARQKSVELFLLYPATLKVKIAGKI